jgi:translation initiation factor IF-3
MIRIPQVRVVDEEGNQLGVMPTPRALEMAQERGYDLVEVAPLASPPVVRFLDFGQYKYELTKREKENKRRQRSVTFKEIRLSPKIGQGDFETKIHRAIEFLQEGDRIKVTVRFRGRELTHPELGRAMLARFAEQIKDHGVVERAPILEGKAMHVTVASLHKPKSHEGAPAPRPAAQPAGRPAGQPAMPVPAAQGAVGTQPVAAAQPVAAQPPAAQAQAPTAATPAAKPAEARPAATAARPTVAAAKTPDKPATAAKAATNGRSTKTTTRAAGGAKKQPAKAPATTGE